MTTTFAPTQTFPGTSPLTAPESRPGLLGSSVTIAGRVMRQFVRTPQLIVVEALTSAMFLLIFRYVFGGAIDTDGVAYADWLIPGVAAGTGLFSSAVVGVASDVESGFFDRLRSLPIPPAAILVGRALADTALVAWGVTITVVLGFLTGFEFHGGVPAALAAFLLCVVFGAAFTWMATFMGLVSGSPQSAQGMSFLVFPIVFVSSAYVPVESMPGWLQTVAEHQPFTMMVGAVRGLTLGDQAEAVLGHDPGWFVVRALLWSVAIVAVFAPLAIRRISRV